MNPKFEEMLQKLLNAKSPTRDTRLDFDIQDLTALCREGIKALQKDPVFLKLEAPLTVFGDIHGQFYDLLEFMGKVGTPPATRYLFLGDYVDRGDNSIETFAMLLLLKIKYPNDVFLLRGNHETKEISQLYGFHDEVMERYDSEKLWADFNEVFRYLPLCAVIGERIFCVHGGLSQELKNLKQLEEFKRPLDIPEAGILVDLLWADPSDAASGYEPSDRGASYTFGKEAAMQFLAENDFDLLCRAHQCVQSGFEFPFYPDQNVLTLFTAPDYCKEFKNNGAVLQVNSQLQCSFQIIERKTAGTASGNRPLTPYY